MNHSYRSLAEHPRLLLKHECEGAQGLAHVPPQKSAPNEYRISLHRGFLGLGAAAIPHFHRAKGRPRAGPMWSMGSRSVWMDLPAGLAKPPAVRLMSWEPICYGIYEMLCNGEEPKDRLS